MTKLSTPRIATGERREQIVATALSLLANTSIEALTTRNLAAELGLTQPALFRHFRNREALLLGVVEHARGELEKIAVTIVEGGHPAVVQLATLGQALLEHAERQPGLPRLIFASATESAGEVRDALRHVVGMQRALVAEMVRQAQREGDIESTLDAGVAATLFVGMLQGLVLRWEMASRGEPLARSFGPVFALWLHGAAPRRDRRGDAPSPATPVAEEPRVALTAPPLVVLDVRPLLARGVDPLETILEALESLPVAGVLIVEAPFRPGPLLSLLKRKGHAVHAEGLGDQHWLVEVVVGATPGVEDLRDLEPPEPLERVLTACAALKSGEVYLARLPRLPRMLLPHLRERDLHFEVLERSDGVALLRIEKLP